jgi:hypothetical protein
LYLNTRDGRRAAQLNLVLGKRRHLIIQYGVSVLDGCAPEASVPVRVAGQDARLRESPGPWTELTWPATLEHPEGIFGLAGSFSKSQMLAMARSMGPAPASTVRDVGC